MYSIPYILIVCAYIILSIVNYRTNSKEMKLKIRFLSALLFFSFFAFRGFIGVDWVNYYVYFNDPSIALESGSEIGFAFLTKTIRFFGVNDYLLYSLIITTIQLILLDNFLKRYSPNIPLSYAILIAIFPVLIIELLRNFLALLIFLQSIRFIIERRFILFAFVLFSAALFHVTIILLFPLYFLSNRIIAKKSILILFGIGLVFYVLQIDLIRLMLEQIASFVGGRYAHLINLYLAHDTFGVGQGIRFGILERIFFFVLLLYKYNQVSLLGKKEPSVIFFTNTFFLFVLINLFFSTMDIIISRVAFLLFFSYIIIIPYLRNLYYFKVNKTVICFCIYVICILKTSMSMDRPTYMYENILFNNSGRENREMIIREARGGRR